MLGVHRMVETEQMAAGESSEAVTVSAFPDGIHFGKAGTFLQCIENRVLSLTWRHRGYGSGSGGGDGVDARCSVRHYQIGSVAIDWAAYIRVCNQARLVSNGLFMLDEHPRKDSYITVSHQNRIVDRAIAMFERFVHLRTSMS